MGSEFMNKQCSPVQRLRPIGRKSCDFLIHSVFVDPFWNFIKRLGYSSHRKPDWWGYPAVKEFLRYVLPFWHNASVWRTDRQTD